MDSKAKVIICITCVLITDGHGLQSKGHHLHHLCFDHRRPWTPNQKSSFASPVFWSQAAMDSKAKPIICITCVLITDGHGLQIKSYHSHHLCFDHRRPWTPNQKLSFASPVFWSQTAMDSKAKAIICITTSGRAPALLSKFRPPMPLLVMSTEGQLVKQCR